MTTVFPRNQHTNRARGINAHGGGMQSTGDEIFPFIYAKSGRELYSDSFHVVSQAVALVDSFKALGGSCHRVGLVVQGHRVQ